MGLEWVERESNCQGLVSLMFPGLILHNVSLLLILFLIPPELVPVAAGIQTALCIQHRAGKQPEKHNNIFYSSFTLPQTYQAVSCPSQPHTEVCKQTYPHSHILQGKLPVFLSFSGNQEKDSCAISTICLKSLDLPFNVHKIYVFFSIKFT